MASHVVRERIKNVEVKRVGQEKKAYIRLGYMLFYYVLKNC